LGGFFLKDFERDLALADTILNKSCQYFWFIGV